VPAVVLFDEEITQDDLHVVQHYKRVKILTQEGVENYANVELNYFSTSDSGYAVDERGNNQSVGDIVGRTIHPDGTVIPFTGKPYQKTMIRGKDFKYQAMVFTLPDVEVGSIIEYRFATRYNDGVYEAPSWYIQGDLYVKSAHYQWFPTEHEMIDPSDDDKFVNNITWFPLLPPGVTVDRTDRPGAVGGTQHIFNLVAHDIAPQPQEAHMAPIRSLSYRVLFNFTSYTSTADYWKSKGKQWSKQVDAFAGPNGDLRKAMQDAIAGATTPDEKLHKIYATVMGLENTRYTREHEAREDKAEGGGKVDSAADVLTHKRGNPEELTKLFVGMARAAGLNAYAMLVPDRSRNFFLPGWLSFQQFDDMIAIVNVDGKDVFFDPGQRYCAYGHLAWQHTFVDGLRQTAVGTDFAHVLGDGYSANKVERVANLKMDEHGQVTGKIDLSFDGAPALGWRHRALSGDDESLRNALRTHLEEMVPKSLEATVTDIKNLDDYDKPLMVSYAVSGTVGSPTGKRLVIPVDLFTAGASATFPQEKRETAVYFDYPEIVQDALAVNFLTGFEVEATPAEGKFAIPHTAVYDMTTTSAPTNFITRRLYEFGEIFIQPADYGTLRGFYSQFEAKDQESVVLKVVPGAAPAGN
jgi:hypothetical protein